MSTIYEATIGEHPVRIEAGKLAGQAGGAVTVRSGDTMVLVTATVSGAPREGTDFLPLTVDYEERLYAAGKIPGGFFKREGRPSEQAILLCRLVDRSLRPLFDRGLRHDVQIIITALSADQENYLDTLSVIGASAALCISDIPFAGPVGAVRVGRVNGDFVLNPTASEMEESDLDVRVSGTGQSVVMVEAGAKEVDEDTMVKAIMLGQESIQGVIDAQRRMAAEIGKPKGAYTCYSIDEEALSAVRSLVDGRIWEVIGGAEGKKQLSEALHSLRDEIVEKLGERYPPEEVGTAFDEVVKSEVRRGALTENRRLDGRSLDAVRPIGCEVGLLPRAHGSGLFSRGETQVLAIATLGTASDEQILDGLGTKESKRFMHHYNFPPYSTGETSFLRAPKRREIGHGVLAETALSSVIPTAEEFPYTVRLVSEVLSSNGSSSMASICAGSLSLMDAGVPITAPVAGMAMGLITDGDRHVILTDIMGKEDALGDMDFKVAGTRQGVTALQMDLKISKVEAEVLKEALERAKEARLYALDRMDETISAARPDLSPYAPRITLLKIDVSKIGLVIGPGGKTIRRIIEETGVKIDVEDDGTVLVASTDAEASTKAVEMIRALTEDPEIGKIYTGTVKRVTDFGAFVEILPGTDGLVHISQLADYHVASVEDVVRVGDEIMVMVVDIDSENKIRLSRRAVLEGWTPEEARAMDKRPTQKRRQQPSGRDGQYPRRRRE
jgi:polyribonucleotide nucleotidyltransferase